MTGTSMVEELLALSSLPLQTRLDAADVVMGWRPAARILIPLDGEVERFVRLVLGAGNHVTVGRGIKWQQRAGAVRCIDWFEQEVPQGAPRGDALERMSVLYLGKSVEASELSRAADEGGADFEFGASLGYPACCRRFVQDRGAVPAISECFGLYASSGHFDPWTWPCTMQVDAALIPHYPCSSACAESRALAESRWRLMSLVGRRGDVDRLKWARSVTYFLSGKGCCWRRRRRGDAVGISKGDCSSARGLPIMLPLTDLPNRLQLIGMDQRFALDLASVALGVRRCALLHVPASIAADAGALAREIGLVEVEAKRLVRRPDAHSREGLLFEHDSASAGSGEVWMELWFERSSSVPSSSSEVRDERALGYPPCCVQAYSGSSSIAAHYRRYLRCQERGRWEINRLSAVFCDGFFMPDFFPCSLSCSAAVTFATDFFKVADQTLRPQTVARWRTVMQGVYGMFEGRLYCWPDWQLEVGALRVENASALSISTVSIAEGIPNWLGPEVLLLPMHHFLTDQELGSLSILRVRCLNGDEIELRCRNGIAGR